MSPSSGSMAATPSPTSACSRTPTRLPPPPAPLPRVALQGRGRRRVKLATTTLNGAAPAPCGAHDVVRRSRRHRSEVHIDEKHAADHAHQVFDEMSKRKSVVVSLPNIYVRVTLTLFLVHKSNTNSSEPVSSHPYKSLPNIKARIVSAPVFRMSLPYLFGVGR
jgi:hypothetical protein